jgi:hypothetical protein
MSLRLFLTDHLKISDLTRIGDIEASFRTIEKTTVFSEVLIVASTTTLLIA